MQRIGLFGGSFNPVHFGHLIPAQSAVEQLALDKLVFIPSAVPPHKLALAGAAMVPAEHRLAMVRLAIAGADAFDVSDVELNRPGPSYTIDTIAAFRQEYGLEVMLYWLIGADSLADLAMWHRAADLVDACQIITLARPGWTIDAALARLRDRLSDEQIGRLASGVLTTPLIEISATAIRHRIATGKSIRFMLPSVVQHYIGQRGLYRRHTEPNNQDDHE